MKILVKSGKYHDQVLSNIQFDMRNDKVKTKDSITTVEIVDPHPIDRRQKYKTIQVFDYELIPERINTTNESSQIDLAKLEEEVRAKFDVMEQLYQAVFNGAIKSLIISGPAGVGKSHSIDDLLAFQAGFQKYTSSKIKGNVTPLYVFEHLRDHAQENHIVVIDDCDVVFTDNAILNVLKACLESGNKKRIVTWGSTRGEKEKSFEFKGSVIFLTNVAFNKMTKNEVIQEHLKALASRSHYLDVSLNSTLEVFIRIKQVCKETDILKSRKYSNGENLSQEDIDEILTFVETNKDNFSELSLRTVVKIADLMVYDKNSYQKLIAITCFKNKYNFFNS